MHYSVSKKQTILLITLLLLTTAFIASSLFSAYRQYHPRSNVLGLSTPPEGKIWSLAFADEFDSTTLNSSNWQAYHNTYGDGNLEEACLTPNNVSVSSGTLKITANREAISCPGKPADSFSSGFIGSRERGKYYPAFGRYEIRAKLPHGQGLWPAFWLRHVNGASTAEIDIMEYFHATTPGTITQTLHFPAEIGANVAKKNTYIESSLQSNWHTWAVDIVPVNGDQTKAKIIFYQDDIKTLEYTPAQFGWLNNYDKNAMFDMAINLAVGGRYTGHPDDELGFSRYLNKCLKPYGTNSPCNGSNINRAVFPSSYEIDYVRVYALADQPTSPPVNTSPNPGTAAPSSPQAPGQNTSNTAPQTKPVQEIQSNKPTGNSGNQSQAQKITVSPSLQKTSPKVELSPHLNAPEVASTILKVEYLIDGKIVQTDTVAPFKFDASQVKGAVTVTERVHYKDGKIEESSKLVEIASPNKVPSLVAAAAGTGLVGATGLILWQRVRLGSFFASLINRIRLH